MEKIKLWSIIGLSCLLFSPSLFNFFSHDDFFNLKLAQAQNLNSFINFFNLVHAPLGFGFYRPLTTQVFFWLDYPFHLNPLPLHIFVYLGFILLLVIVYKLSAELFSKQIAYLTTFFYGISASHFGHLYYLSTFQEIGLGICVFLSLLFFTKALRLNQIKFYLFSLIFLSLGLLSKETAVVTPFFWLLIYFYLPRPKLKPSLIIFATLSLSLITIYLFLHIFYYGLSQGDSYVWKVSPRVFNTAFWYLLWSVNIPELFIDYIGPGLRINPNLFTFYGQYVAIILSVFGIFLTGILVQVITRFKNLTRSLRLAIFCIVFFVIGILPVIFLPLHKFSYELTLSAFATSLFLAWICQRTAKGLLILILTSYLLTSTATSVLIYNTHWIVRGGEIARFTKNYFDLEINKYRDTTVVFYDSDEDKQYPWSPTSELSIILSNRYFFEVLFKQARINPIYDPTAQVSGLKLRARNFVDMKL